MGSVVPLLKIEGFPFLSDTTVELPFPPSPTITEKSVLAVVPPGIEKKVIGEKENRCWPVKIVIIIGAFAWSVSGWGAGDTLVLIVRVKR